MKFHKMAENKLYPNVLLVFNYKYTEQGRRKKIKINNKCFIILLLYFLTNQIVISLHSKLLEYRVLRGLIG